MTPSTTNTAARPCKKCQRAMTGYCDSCAATLTQQQGGEQEAGDVERQTRELLAAEYERNGWGAVASRIRDDELAGEIAFHVPYALRAITAALRSKQPAASEGDVVGWQIVQKNRLSVGGMYRTQEEAIESGMFDAEIDELRPLYTSKQAAL